MTIGLTAAALAAQLLAAGMPVEPVVQGMAGADVATEMRAITAAHGQLGSYAVLIDTEFSRGDGPPTHLAAAVRCDSRARCLRRVGGLETLETPRWTVAANHRDRTLVVSKRASGDAIAAPSPDPAAALEAWLAKGLDVSGGELTADGRRWAFGGNLRGGADSEMFVDPHSRLVQRIRYRIAEGAEVSRVDIRYTWQDPDRLPAEELEETRFLQEVGGDVVAAKAYAGYRIIRADRR